MLLKIIGSSVAGAMVGALVLFLITKFAGDPRHLPQHNYNLIVWISTLMGFCSGAIIGAMCGLASGLSSQQKHDSPEASGS